MMLLIIAACFIGTVVVVTVANKFPIHIGDDEY